MVEPSPHTFDEAQLQIYTLMHRDSYPRFINSQMYRRLMRTEDEKTWLGHAVANPVCWKMLFCSCFLLFFKCPPSLTLTSSFLFLSSRDIPQCGRTIVAGMRRPTTSPMREKTKTNQIILQSIRGVRCPLDHRRYEIKVFLLFMYIFLQNISSLSRHISILTRARHSIPRLSTVMDPSSSSSSFSSSVVCVCVSLRIIFFSFFFFFLVVSVCI